jgi:hypothetical protein
VKQEKERQGMQGERNIEFRIADFECKNLKAKNVKSAGNESVTYVLNLYSWSTRREVRGKRFFISKSEIRIYFSPCPDLVLNL